MKISAKNRKKLEAFGWRTWNTFKSTVLPIALSVIVIKLQDTPEDTSILLTWDLWNAVIYAVIIAMSGALIAGADKMRRV